MEDQIAKVNPYDWINPIYDPRLFAARKEELSRVMDELLRINQIATTPIIAITGDRRVGKTSILLRIKENCLKNHLKSVIIPIEKIKVKQSWDFWNEIFSALFMLVTDAGIDVIGHIVQEKPIGFLNDEIKSKSGINIVFDDLLFSKSYQLYYSGARILLSTSTIQNDLAIIIKALNQSGYSGLIFLLDEAHNLMDSEEIKQQIRIIIQGVPNCGIVFSGERILSRMFTDTSEPFFGQAKVIPIGNFWEMDDVAECALIPLDPKELELMSPATIHYIARLSKGKPNQIRLICSAIYKRYLKGQQKDLGITIDVLDDVIDSISQSYEEPDLMKEVKAIQKLNSAELELLHDMTRYPNWTDEDIVDLDESFRGDFKSQKASERRKKSLLSKKEHFVKLGLMMNDEQRFRLVGGEFLALYLRFIYETRKFGELSKELILGKGPTNLFGETTDKLVKSFAFHFGQAPELQRLIFHNFHRDFGDILDRIKKRFSLLQQLMNGDKLDSERFGEILTDCFSVCELIGKAGNYYLLCLSVRNRDNPREIIEVELHFDLSHSYEFDLGSLFNLLTKQAEEGRVLIEGYHGFWVELPDLEGLLKRIGLGLEDFLKGAPLLAKWQIFSVGHFIREKEKEKEKKRTKDNNDKNQQGKDDKKISEWIELYEKGEEEEAQKSISKELGLAEARNKRAMLYNDLGYIRSGSKKADIYELAHKDLETAFDLHYSHLPLTLMNLGFLDLEKGNFSKGIERIEETLILTTSPIEAKAAYLRFRLAENNLGFRVACEETPANVIEVAYINLAYCCLKSKGYDEAAEVIREGMELLPSSNRLKHAFGSIISP